MKLAERIGVLRTGFARTFWVANVLELFERFSFYGSKIVLAVFLAETVGLGPFGVSLVGLYGFAVYFLPILAGPFVDRYGFKKSLAACFAIFSLGYFLIGLSGLPDGAAARRGRRDEDLGRLRPPDHGDRRARSSSRASSAPSRGRRRTRRRRSATRSTTRS